ncbi:MAG: 1-acyl-sn-glycerol-3-phosphate acyltransferase [Thiovulaceae bacterium]|nr:1-acyl-sn-glycerol-3-phosphate acyltransferase [Sulfurimonadaceae bacterium]MDD3816999.1 1-acyl-sn-glycerol-3-phosphate acyltransferase [Sulfurimonadaceae bacterium]
MDLGQIEAKILALSPFVRHISLTRRNGALHAVVTPDFKALAQAHIINIENQIRWYVLEIYNFDVPEELKIRSYEIEKPPHAKEFSFDTEEPLYLSLLDFLASHAKEKITPSSHLELDLGFDSLDFVTLLLFVEESFGVKLDEAALASLLVVGDLYLHIRTHATCQAAKQKSWREILEPKKPIGLRYSPFIMFLYKTLLYPFFRLYFRLELRGRDNIPNTPCIIAPSHQSMLDGFLIEATLPYGILKRTFFLAFELVFGTKLLKPVADNGQTILINQDKNLLYALQKTAQPLREDANIVIFPEGARTRDGNLLEFRPFFAILSKEFNVPVVPVLIDGSFEALPPGKRFFRPKKIQVHYLEPIFPEGLSVKEIVKQTKDAIEEDIVTRIA